MLGNEQMQMGQTIRVNLDGTIQIPKIGNVQVSGLNIQEANEKVNSVYSEVSIGTKVILSMKELQPFQIFVLGASNNPGAYTVNPLTTVSNALILSGGVDDYGSLRNIELKEGKKLTNLICINSLFMETGQKTEHCVQEIQFLYRLQLTLLK